ncbi:hypothetical protein Tco_1108415 [Tanacetum coccineum]
MAALQYTRMITTESLPGEGKRGSEDFTPDILTTWNHSHRGEAIPLSPPMLAIAAAGDAADEPNAAANEAAGSTAEAHHAPHSPPFSPVRESTPERQPETEWVVPNPVSPVFGPVPKPAGYVDPDTIDPIIFGPPPRPYDFVDPALEEPVIFGPLPRPANYIAPEDRDNLNSMEDDTILGGFHEETHAGPDDAPTTTADAAGRAEDPALLTSLSAKLDRCMGRIDLLETELGTSKKIKKKKSCGGALTALITRVKKFGANGKTMRSHGWWVIPPASKRSGMDIQDAVDLEGLSRMASEALGHDQATDPSEDIEEPKRRGSSSGRLLSPDLDNPAEIFLAEDAQAGNAYEEERGKVRLVPRQLQRRIGLRHTSSVSEHPADGFLLQSHRELGISPFADSDESSSPSSVSTDHKNQASNLCSSLNPHQDVIHAFFLDSDEDEQIGLSRVATEPDSDDDVLAEILFHGQYVSGAGVVVVDKLPDDEIVDPRVKVEPISKSPSSPPRSRSKHRGVRSDTSLWDRPVDVLSLNLRENRRHKNFFYLKELLPHVYREDLLLLRRRMNMPLHSDDVEDLENKQDEWVRECVWEIISQEPVQDGLRESYECLASAPIRERDWLTIAEQALVCNSIIQFESCKGLLKILWPSHTSSWNKEWQSKRYVLMVKTFSNPLMVAKLPKTGWLSLSIFFE